DAQHRLPYPALEIGTVIGQRQVEIAQGSGEIGAKLALGLDQHRIFALCSRSEVPEAQAHELAALGDEGQRPQRGVDVTKLGHSSFNTISRAPASVSGAEQTGPRHT